jgi:hypothetical protein
VNWDEVVEVTLVERFVIVEPGEALPPKPPSPPPEPAEVCERCGRERPPRRAIVKRIKCDFSGLK